MRQAITPRTQGSVARSTSALGSVRNCSSVRSTQTPSPFPRQQCRTSQSGFPASSWPVPIKKTGGIPAVPDASRKQSQSRPHQGQRRTSSRPDAAPAKTNPNFGLHVRSGQCQGASGPWWRYPRLGHWPWHKKATAPQRSIQAPEYSTNKARLRRQRPLRPPDIFPRANSVSGYTQAPRPRQEGLRPNLRNSRRTSGSSPTRRKAGSPWIPETIPTGRPKDTWPE